MLKIPVPMRVKTQERSSVINKHIKIISKGVKLEMGRTRGKIILIEQPHLLVHMYGKILDMTFFPLFTSQKKGLSLENIKKLQSRSTSSLSFKTIL